MKNKIIIFIQVVLAIVVVAGITSYFIPWQEIAINRLNDVELVVQSESNNNVLQIIGENGEVFQQGFNNSEPLEVTIENLNAIDKIYANGWLVIPQEGVGISLPINAGVGGNNMLYGAGEQFPHSTVRAGGLGNYVLASHITAYPNQLFTNLHLLNVGSTVHIADENNVYVYEVTSSTIETIGDTSYIIAQPTEPTVAELTIYTCSDLYATKRYVVKGKLMSVTKIDKNLNPETRVAFSRWLQSIGK